MAEKSKPVCWLIGASHGIGAALAPILSRDYQVVVSSRSRGVLPNEIAFIPIDVQKLDTVQHAYQNLKKEKGVPALVIYLAGIYEPTSYQQANLEQSVQTIDVNFNGVLRILDTIRPDVYAKKIDHLAFVSSVAGYYGLPNSYAYGASKAALINLSESLRTELDKIVKVQLISPGFVQTRLTDKNTFKMPALLSPEQAATCIAKGLKREAFEIHFPKSFTYKLKLVGLLPYGLFFKIMRYITHNK